MPKTVAFFDSYNDARKIPSDIRPQIAFAGRSNVGKSTLLNKLSGRKKLAKISKTPGRTRRIDFYLVDDRYFFVDLPGYGYVKSGVVARKKWGLLVEGYFKLDSGLKGLIFLLDCRRVPNADDLMMIDWMEQNDINYVTVMTKADKLTRSKLAVSVNKIKQAVNSEIIPFSSLSGIGKKELTGWIEKTLNNEN
jgi:GTP-binding protein